MKPEEKLEQKMFEAIEKARVEWGQAFGGNLHRFMAKEVAKIALELAKEAFIAGGDGVEYSGDTASYNTVITFNQFIEDYD